MGVGQGSQPKASGRENRPALHASSSLVSCERAEMCPLEVRLELMAGRPGSPELSGTELLSHLTGHTFHMYVIQIGLRHEQCWTQGEGYGIWDPTDLSLRFKLSYELRQGTISKSTSVFVIEGWYLPQEFPMKIK